jgi:hypothetical protein
LNNGFRCIYNNLVIHLLVWLNSCSSFE